MVHVLHSIEKSKDYSSLERGCNHAYLEKSMVRCIEKVTIIPLPE